MAKAILFDASKCTGCRACQVACKSWNQRGYTRTNCNGTYENPPELTSQSWMRIKFNEEDVGTPASPDIRWFFTKYQCMHCEEATCVNVCPTGATQKYKVSNTDSEAYVVMTDPKMCIGCNYCVATCPFQACRYDQREKGIFRCRLCFDRITSSGKKFRFRGGAEQSQGNGGNPRNIPACVLACTTGALSFGEREEMVKKASERVNFLKTQRNRKEAQVYGADPVGGVGNLRYIYVLEAPPEKYGLPTNPTVPGGVSVWEALAKPAGSVALAGMAVALGINYIIERRNAALEKKEEKTKEGVQK